MNTNPFIVDELSGDYDGLSTMEDELKKLILKQNQRDIFDGVVESVRAKEKLKEILNEMNISENVRGENLTLEQFAQISNKIGNM